MIDGIFRRTVDLNGDVLMTPLKSLYATGDKSAQTFQLTIQRDGKPESLSGASVSGYFIRNDGYTVVINGSLNENIVSVTLPESCYAQIGQFNLIIKLFTSDETKSIFWGNGYVTRSRTDSIVDPGKTIPSLEELLEQISAIETATKAANSAASSASSATSAANAAATNANNATKAANSAASSASSATSAANAAATNANNATKAANSAADKINDMTVQVSGLEAGVQPTANLELVDGHYNLSFSIPQGDKGDKGDTGATPQVTVQVKTGEPGTVAKVEQSGTAENPVIALTIPRGDTGSIGNLTINGKAPDETGAVTLTAADVGARADDWMPTAADVGARADDWMPTAADVGALSGTDATLTEAGKAADAKATGDAIGQLKSDIADVWSPDVIYKHSDYCIYNNVLYKCKTQNQNSVPPSMDWETCTISGELLTTTTVLKESIFANNVKDLDNPPATVLLNTGVNPIGKPPALAGNGCFVIQHNAGQGNYCAQLAFGFGDFKLALRVKANSPNWSSWKYISFS